MPAEYVCASLSWMQVAYKDRALAAAAARAERERAAARQRDDELGARVAGVLAELQAHVVLPRLGSSEPINGRAGAPVDVSSAAAQ